MSSTVINVKQIGSYPKVTATVMGDLLLLQQGGLGGSYVSIDPVDMLSSLTSGRFTFSGAVVATEVQASVIGASSVTARAFVQAGDPVATIPDLEAAIGQIGTVTSFNQRTGDILLEDVDILAAGGAPQANPHFSGWVTAPSHWNASLDDDTVATANWTQRAMCQFFENWLELQPVVFTFNGRAGNITLLTSDVNAAYAVPGSIPTAPNPSLGDASNRIATTLFVDESLADYAPLYSPQFQGIPTAPTPEISDNSNAIATTAFVTAITGSSYHAMGWVNIKDFGAVGDGVHNEVSAFNAFNTWARGQTVAVTLVIPPGTYAGINSNAGGGSDFFVGVKDLTIIGYGATIPIMRGCNGLAVNPSSPIVVWAPLGVQANSGATTVTLATPSQSSQFAVGNWVCVCSLEMQGSGFPPNWYYVDYVQITAINATTGVLTFADALNYTHKITYPDTTVPPGSGTAHSYPGSNGGPATVFALVPEWDSTLKVFGLTVSASLASGPSLETILTMRRGRFVDCTFICSVAPSLSMFSVFENCTFIASPGGYYIEVDKNLLHMKLINCRIHQMLIQSASVDMVIDGCHISSLSFNARNLDIRNSYVGFWSLSAPAVGANRKTSIYNCQIAAFAQAANVNYILLSNLTFTNGTFSIPLASAQALTFYRLAIPGSKCFFNSNQFYNLGNPFMILSVYQDATNIYADTTLTALPTYSGTGTASPGIVQHTCPRLIAGNNTGSDTVVTTGKQAKELPIYSYAHKVYCEDLIQTGTAAITQPIQQWGTFVSLKVNVIRADTGANVTLTMHPIGKFGANVMPASNVMGAFDLTINLKTAGVRTVTPTTVTGNVAGDVITAPGTVWFTQTGINPWMSASIAANTAVQMPIVEIELVTDQGITAFEYTVQ